MTTHVSPPFTPAQLIDAGRRAEAENRFDLAVQFYRALIEHFAEAPETVEAFDALARIGAGLSNRAPQEALPRTRRRHFSSRADRYAGGRALARLFTVLGWLVAAGGAAGLPLSLLARAEPIADAELLPLAGGATGSLILGLAVILAAQLARARFDQASAARDLVAIERARLGLD